MDNQGPDKQGSTVHVIGIVLLQVDTYLLYIHVGIT